MNNTELKIEFWKELWVDLIQNFLKRSYGFSLYSPQILVEDIIIEIEDNKFRNQDNKRYFSIKVKDYLEKDEVINAILKPDFLLLQRAIQTNKNEYILSLCKQIKATLEKGVYFKRTLQLIQNIILSDKEIDLNYVNKINYYSENLIVEFIKKSYVLEDIEDFISNIFDGYSYHKYSSNLNTNFPHQIKYDNHKTVDGNTDLESFESAIKNKIDSLTFKDRIKTLNYYYNKKTEKAYYIFVIRGLKSELNIDKTFFGINFHTVDEKKLSAKNKSLWENLQRESKPDEKYLQAKVEVDYLSPISSYIPAVRKLETAIDLLHCYFNIKIPLSYAEYGFVIYDKKDKLLFSKIGGKSPTEQSNHFNSLDISEREKHFGNINKFKFLWNDKSNNESLSRIKNALRWHRKAEQSTRDEDKILNYWIALETLFKTKNEIIGDIISNPKNKEIHLIQEIVSSRELFNFVYEYGWELYWYYKNKRTQYFKKNNLPKEIIEKAQLSVNSGEIYLKNFIDQLNEIKKYENNLFVIDKIDSVEKFYKDYEYTKLIINKNITNTKNDILMIYRLRNLIVHNAHYDNTLLPYYSWKVKTYCGGLLRRFIEVFENKKTLSAIIFDIYINKEKFLIDLNNGIVNLFEND